MSLTFKDVAEIIKIIDASACDELIVEVPGAKIVVRRNGRSGEPAIAAGPAAAPRVAGQGTAGPGTREVGTSVSEPTDGTKARAGGGIGRDDGKAEVRSPMVGTFYRAQSPKDPPLVEIGTVVKPGDPLCLIEVMKLYTTIASEQAGRIVEILPGNAQLVEYDQVLFVIEPA